MKQKKAVLSLSGGMDSSTLLLHLLANDYEVTALSFDYGQKHKVELERAVSLVEYINSRLINEGKVPIVHQVVKLDGLQHLLASALVEGGHEVPEGHYEQDNMKETVVPNRNKIFSSIIQAVALSIATKADANGTPGRQDVIIAMGIHSGDHGIYPDCRPEFRDADMEAFQIGNWDAELVTMYTPYLYVTKFEILQDGEICCEKLGLDFNEVYKRTNTSYKPIKSSTGVWYSDYKSAASVERVESFIRLGRVDPVTYADETGEVGWEVVKSHAIRVIEGYHEEANKKLDVSPKMPIFNIDTEFI